MCVDKERLIKSLVLRTAPFMFLLFALDKLYGFPILIDLIPIFIYPPIINSHPNKTKHFLMNLRFSDHLYILSCIVFFRYYFVSFQVIFRCNLYIFKFYMTFYNKLH